MDQNALAKARKDLNSIISNYSYQAFLNTNRKKDGTFYKKRRQYSIPAEAETALEILRLTYKEDITKEDEELIKGFLIVYRTLRTEYLKTDIDSMNHVKN